MKVEFCFTSVKSILEDEKGGQYEILVTGRAIDNILESISEGTIDDKHIACLYFMHNLNQTVISRSSPNTKQSVISSLKKYCDMNVMMCGEKEFIFIARFID
jgi:magnesium-transporting ATPase (P-type)